MVLKKGKEEKTNLSRIRTCCEGTVPYWHSRREVGQWNRIACPETHLCIYGTWHVTLMAVKVPYSRRTCFKEYS